MADRTGYTLDWMSEYAKKNLNEVDDSAVKHGFSETQMARFAGADLGCETVGLALEGVKPGCRQAFGHRHEQAEEVYVVVKGSGRMKLGEEVIDVGPLDAIRVAPGVTRQFEAGSERLDFIVAGARHPGDGELIQDWWTD
jgi:mannose-6-phosphate isomerase-like protein (cupin superfamily)